MYGMNRYTPPTFEQILEEERRRKMAGQPVMDSAVPALLERIGAAYDPMKQQALRSIERLQGGGLATQGETLGQAQPGGATLLSALGVEQPSLNDRIADTLGPDNSWRGDGLRVNRSPDGSRGYSAGTLRDGGLVTVSPNGATQKLGEDAPRIGRVNSIGQRDAVDPVTLAENREAAQTKRGVELERRTAHRQQYYKDQEADREQNAILSRIFGNPRLAAEYIQQQGLITKTGMETASRERLGSEVGAGNLRQTEMEAATALIRAGIQSGDQAMVKEGRDRLAAAGGGESATPAGPVVPPADPGTDGRFSASEVGGWLDRVSPEAITSETLPAGMSVEDLVAAMGSLEDGPWAESEVEKAIRLKRLEKLRSIVQQITGVAATGQAGLPSVLPKVAPPAASSWSFPDIFGRAGAAGLGGGL
jgi:hypothetical protein